MDLSSLHLDICVFVAAAYFDIPDNVVAVGTLSLETQCFWNIWWVIHCGYNYILHLHTCQSQPSAYCHLKAYSHSPQLWFPNYRTNLDRTIGPMSFMVEQAPTPLCQGLSSKKLIMGELMNKNCQTSRSTILNFDNSDHDLLLPLANWITHKRT